VQEEKENTNHEPSNTFLRCTLLCAVFECELCEESKGKSLALSLPLHHLSSPPRFPPRHPLPSSSSWYTHLTDVVWCCIRLAKKTNWLWSIYLSSTRSSIRGTALQVPNVVFAKLFLFLLVFGSMLFLYNFRPIWTYSHALARHYGEICLSAGIKSAPEPLYLIQQILQMDVRQCRVR
jgi:hypothetical protein